MRIFKSVDEKLKEIGFNKICEDKYGAHMNATIQSTIIGIVLTFYTKPLADIFYSPMIKT